jgi:hypothetical protein
MNPRDLLPVIQSFVSTESGGASTLRGQGAGGMVRVARTYCSAIDLSVFGTSRLSSFSVQLDETTEDLRLKFPQGGRHWGAARKVMNVFLRNAYYNQFLCSQFHLERAVALYEVPLDSIVADELRRLDEARCLPRWPGVKYLQPDTNTRYQDFLLKLASCNGLQRVHLDAILWLRDGRHLTRGCT